MKANELEMVRTARASDCLVMDTGEETKKIPFGEAALILRPGVNLMINSDFRKPVNQRGLEEYTAAGYTIDRWKLLSGSLSVMDGFIRLTKEQPQWALQYKFDDYCVIPGYSYTLSFLLKSNKKILFVIWYGASKYLIKEFEASSALEIKEFTFTMQTPDSGFRPSFIIQTLENDTVIDLTAAKLELGSQQTLARQDAAGNWVLNDPPPDKALGLLKCQKYQYKNTNGSTEFIRASAIVADAIYFDIPVPVPMRATPVISNPENIELIDLTSRTILTGFSIGVSNHEGATIRINAVKQNHGVTDAYLKATAVLFDANL